MTLKMRHINSFTATLLVLSICLYPSVLALEKSQWDKIQPSGNITNEYINNTYINQTVNATVNTTQFDSNNPIGIKMSWLQSMIEYFTPAPDLSNYYNKSTSDNRFCFANGTNSQGLECGYTSSRLITPINNSVHISEEITFNFSINNSIIYLNYDYLYESECSGLYCQLTLPTSNYVEGYNSLNFLFLDAYGEQIDSLIVSFYYYSDIQSLADATEEHNVKSTWLEDIKDWILDIARTLFYEKDSNINATGYNITADYYFGDGSQLTGIASGLPENISINGSLSYAGGQSNPKNYMNFSRRLSDWNTLVFNNEGISQYYFAYYTGTITGWDIMNSQAKSMPNGLSCRNANTVGADCILALVGRTPATSSFYYNSVISNSAAIKKMFIRNKFWSINSTLAVGAVQTGQVSATLSNILTGGSFVGFYVAPNETGEGNWLIRCGGYKTAVDTGIPYQNNIWYNFLMEGNQKYGYNQLATNFNFYINGNFAGNCSNGFTSDMYYSFVGSWNENSFAGSTAGQDIIVWDKGYLEQNVFNYNDVWTNFNGGSSAP